jgi:hypothetical protein
MRRLRCQVKLRVPCYLKGKSFLKLSLDGAFQIRFVGLTCSTLLHNIIMLVFCRSISPQHLEFVSALACFIVTAFIISVSLLALASTVC